MSQRRPVEGWRWSARVVALAGVGAFGVASRWIGLPRWSVLAVAVVVPVVWLATGFEATRAGETEAERRRRMRNMAIGLALFALVALFYAATMIRLGAQALNPPL